MKKLECKRCGHKWVKRIKKVVMCPACKSRYWNVAKDHPVHCGQSMNVVGNDNEDWLECGKCGKTKE